MSGWPFAFDGDRRGGMCLCRAHGEVEVLVRLTSTVAEYQELAKIEDQASRLKAWTTGYEAAHRDVFEVYYRSYSDPRRRNGAVADVARISPLVRGREARAEALARQTEQEFRAQGLLDELNVVLLVGNHTANGWIAEFHGRQTMFVALELLGAPPYDSILFPTRPCTWRISTMVRQPGRTTSAAASFKKA